MILNILFYIEKNETTTNPKLLVITTEQIEMAILYKVHPDQNISAK